MTVKNKSIILIIRKSKSSEAISCEGTKMTGGFMFLDFKVDHSVNYFKANYLSKTKA